MDQDKENIRISKLLSKILRHKAENYGLKIDESGLVSVNDLLNLQIFKSQKITFDKINQIVQSNNKKRFKLVKNESNGLFYICALQGHSINSINQTPEMVSLSNSQLPDLIIHGTTLHNWHLIEKSNALSRMKRNHIHFTQYLSSEMIDKIKLSDPTLNLSYSNDNKSDAITGIRYNCQVLIFLDIEKLRNSDLIFYKSANGVILSPGDVHGTISSDYFKHVVLLK